MSKEKLGDFMRATKAAHPEWLVGDFVHEYANAAAFWDLYHKQVELPSRWCYPVAAPCGIALLTQSSVPGSAFVELSGAGYARAPRLARCPVTRARWYRVLESPGVCMVNATLISFPIATADWPPIMAIEMIYENAANNQISVLSEPLRIWRNDRFHYRPGGLSITFPEAGWDSFKRESQKEFEDD